MTRRESFLSAVGLLVGKGGGVEEGIKQQTTFPPLNENHEEMMKQLSCDQSSTEATSSSESWADEQEPTRHRRESEVTPEMVQTTLVINTTQGMTPSLIEVTTKSIISGGETASTAASSTTTFSPTTSPSTTLSSSTPLPTPTPFHMKEESPSTPKETTNWKRGMLEVPPQPRESVVAFAPDETNPGGLLAGGGPDLPAVTQQQQQTSIPISPSSSASTILLSQMGGGPNIKSSKPIPPSLRGNSPFLLEPSSFSTTPPAGSSAAPSSPVPGTGANSTEEYDISGAADSHEAGGTEDLPDRPNRGRLLVRPHHHSFYPYFLNRVLG